MTARAFETVLNVGAALCVLLTSAICLTLLAYVLGLWWGMR